MFNVFLTEVNYFLFYHGRQSFVIQNILREPLKYE